MEYSIDNVHVAAAQAMAEASGVPQITICKTSRGIEFRGNWDIKAMLEDVQKEEEEKDAVSMDWVPDKASIPALPMSLEDIIKKPNMLKTAATKALKAFLVAGRLKLGKGTFAGWSFPVEKAYFVHTASHLSKLPSKFKMSDIISWEALDGGSISNGPRAGSAAIKPSSGVKTWLAVVKILMEFLCLMGSTGRAPDSNPGFRDTSRATTTSRASNTTTTSRATTTSWASTTPTTSTTPITSSRRPFATPVTNR